ncbi:hypothetical protein FB446DRAFT_708634 [Lentinula raphanica]|nr:hypothetical protein FB446DRAFT_708634 [Lentinula raphanica]
MGTVSTVTGPIFLGHLINWCLFGILLYTVFAFEVLQTAFATHSGWYALASGWGNPVALIDVTWSLALIPALTGIVSALGQLFLVWAMRVAIETGAATTIAAFVGLALGLANGKIYVNALLANLNSRTKIVDTVESGQSQTGVQIWQVKTQGVGVDSALLAQHIIDRQNDNGNIELSEFLVSVYSSGAKSEPLLDSV